MRLRESRGSWGALAGAAAGRFPTAARPLCSGQAAEPGTKPSLIGQLAGQALGAHESSRSGRSPHSPGLTARGLLCFEPPLLPCTGVPEEPPSDPGCIHGSVEVAGREADAETSTGRGQTGGGRWEGARASACGQEQDAVPSPPPADPGAGAAQKHEHIAWKAPLRQPGRTFQKPRLAQGQRLSGHNRKTLWLLSHQPPNGEATMTADGPNHQQHRTNKRKAKSDVSLVLIKRVNLALGLMGGQPTLPTGAALGLGAESDSAGPWAGGVGGQRAAPSPSLLLLTPRSPTSPPAHTVPGGRPAPPLPGHSRVGGGTGRSAPPLQPPQLEDHTAPWKETGRAWTPEHTLMHTRTHKHTHARAHARPAHSSLRGGPIWAGQRRPPCCPTSRPLGPGPQVCQPTLDVPISAVVKEDERAAWTGTQGHRALRCQMGTQGHRAPRCQAGLLAGCGLVWPRRTPREPDHRQAPSPWAATSLC